MSTPRDRRKREKNDVGGKADGRGEKPQSRQKSKPDTTLPQTDDVNRQMYERTLYMTLNLVGRVVQVQVKSGAMYEGIFHTAQADKGFGVVLLMAKKKEPGATTFSGAAPTVIIQGKDFVQMTAKDVTLDESSDVTDDAFMTDTDISGHMDMRERELQPWIPDADVSTDMSLTGSSGARNDWDQFAVNEKLFGVRTTYEEEIYTTKLDKGSHKYAEQARIAQRIADEIEGKAATNAHMAEERGQIGSDDMDEEEKYSSVIRSGVYVPPAKRAQQKQPAQSADTNNNNNKDNGNDLNTSSELQIPVGEDELRTSAGSPLSPSMTPLSPKDKFTSTSVADRLKLRRALVNETHRTSPTPAHPNNDVVAPRSPLHSPLVGDHKTITALGLEPRAPAVPEGVAREFLNFSLGEKAKQNPPSSRQATTADLKQFSIAFGKRPASPATHGSAPTSPGPVNPSAQAPDAVKPTATTPTTAATPATPTAPSSTPAATTTTTTTSTTSTTTPAAAPTTPATGSTTAPTLRPLTSKLNPNAKAFTPMSANAPVFTPKGFVPAHPAPAPLMSPVEHTGPVFFHPGGPMQPPPHHQHHPPPPSHGQPPPHVQQQQQQQPAPPLVSDSRPLTEIYCDSLKRKQHQEKSETIQPYWFSTRGSYRTNVEEMDPNLRPPQPFPPPPGAPPALTPMGVMHAIPIGPNLGPNQHIGPNQHGPHGPHPLQGGPPGVPMGHNFPPPPYVSVIPNPGMGMVMNMGPPPVPIPVGAVGGPPQPQVVPGPIFIGQPGMRPFPHPGAPMPVGMAPGQPPYVAYPPQMTPLSPPSAHQPQSPQTANPQQPNPQSPSHSQSPTPQQANTPPSNSATQPHPQSPTPVHAHSPSHAHSPHASSPVGGVKRAFYPHSPQSPHTPHSPTTQPKSGYTPQQQPHT